MALAMGDVDGVDLDPLDMTLGTEEDERETTAAHPDASSNEKADGGDTQTMQQSVGQTDSMAFELLDTSWQHYANCMGVDPDLFFPERGASTREAKEACRNCVVREDCLEYALSHGEKFGIWGGLSERERRRERRLRARLGFRTTPAMSPARPVAVKPPAMRSNQPAIEPVPEGAVSIPKIQHSPTFTLEKRIMAYLRESQSGAVISEQGKALEVLAKKLALNDAELVSLAAALNALAERGELRLGTKLNGNSLRSIILTADLVA